MKQWDFLKQKFEAGKLGHAYVLSGRDVESLKTFANDFAKLINCKFPDVITVRSVESKSSLTNEKDMMEIVIEQIRDVQNFLSYKSYYGGFKTVIIENAERLTIDAQDCFLKNLEEPKGQTLIFLISAKPELLRQTILSRCQIITFHGVPEALPLPQNLQNILGGDLAEKFQYAKQVNLEGENFENILHTLQNYWRKDIAKYKKVLNLALELETAVKVSNINKKLALEILLLQV